MGFIVLLGAWILISSGPRVYQKQNDPLFLSLCFLLHVTPDSPLSLLSTFFITHFFFFFPCWSPPRTPFFKTEGGRTAVIRLHLEFKEENKKAYLEAGEVSPDSCDVAARRRCSHGGIASFGRHICGIGPAAMRPALPWLSATDDGGSRASGSSARIRMCWRDNWRLRG